MIAQGEARFDAVPESAGAARSSLRARLSAVPVLDPPLEPGLLLASVLVTNAVLHAQTDAELRYVVEPARVRIEVEDGNTRHPVVVATPVDATSGRGLGMVEPVADRWGVNDTDDGKVVWFELPITRS